MTHRCLTHVAWTPDTKFTYTSTCSCGFDGDGITYAKESEAIDALRILHLPRRAIT